MKLNAKYQVLPGPNGRSDHAEMVLIRFAVVFYYRKGFFENFRGFTYLFVKLIFKKVQKRRSDT